MRSTSRNIICEKQPFGGGRRAVFLCAGMGSFAPRRRVHYLSPTGIILRLRARDGAFRAPARVTFFFCKKKVTKENHSNLRFKDPLARGRQVQIWRCWLRGIGSAGDVVGSGIACTACAAAADAVRVGVFASAGLGEFRRPGGEQVLRLRAQAGVFRAPARVTFFCCQKKVTKENHLDLRSKGPLARGGQVQIWRC